MGNARELISPPPPPPPLFGKKGSFLSDYGIILHEATVEFPSLSPSFASIGPHWSWPP